MIFRNKYPLSSVDDMVSQKKIWPQRVTGYEVWAQFDFTSVSSKYYLAAVCFLMTVNFGRLHFVTKGF